MLFFYSIFLIFAFMQRTITAIASITIVSKKYDNIDDSRTNKNNSSNDSENNKKISINENFKDHFRKNNLRIGTTKIKNNLRQQGIYEKSRKLAIFIIDPVNSNCANQ